MKKEITDILNWYPSCLLKPLPNIYSLKGYKRKQVIKNYKRSKKNEG